MSQRILIELVLAVVLLGVGIWLYRKPATDADGRPSTTGNQGAVLLIVVALVLGVHGLAKWLYPQGGAQMGTDTVEVSQ